MDPSVYRSGDYRVSYVLMADVDEETFGDAAADVDAGVGLPDFFTTKDTSGDQEFTRCVLPLHTLQ